MSAPVEVTDAVLATAGDVLAGAGHRLDLPLLAVGVVLHLAADVVRNRGWHAILCAASPDHSALRVRDVQAAAFAGGGVNTLVPARAGDLVKVGLIRRRLPEARFATVMASFLPETLFEFAVGLGLLTWALTAGYLPVDLFTATPAHAAAHPLLATAVATGAALGLLAGAAVLRRRARRVYGDLAAGLAILRRPRVFVSGVVRWQLASRVIRLGAIACCLAACHLPGVLAAAALTMAVEGGTRVRFAPLSATLRVGLLVHGLPAATGTAVSVGAVIAYIAVVRFVRTAVLLAIAAAVLAATLGCGSPRRALAAMRLREAAAREPLAPTARAVPGDAPGGSA